LNTAVWGYYPGGSSSGAGNNNLASDPALVTVSGGYLNLAVSGSNGGMVASGWAEDFTAGAGEGAAKGYALPVGGYVEARIKFQGSGSTIYGWPAFWASRRLSWPESGEYDIAEGYDGLLGPGYWQGTSEATAFGTSGPKASFAAANTFHTYGVYRGASVADFYYDGKLQWSEPTHDDGTPASIILNTGAGDTGGINAQPQPNATGVSMQVDYVRAWQ
jgi:beta-glucanase (GH16 family)